MRGADAGVEGLTTICYGLSRGDAFDYVWRPIKRMKARSDLA
jgi:hypothetical protein